MADSSPLPITQPTCAARDGDGPCHGVPHIPCPKCLVVAYCDPACRKKHWAVHKLECCADFPGKHKPAIDEAVDGKSTFWAREPATDVINIEKNEGIGYDDNIRLLLTGFTAFRHLIYSIAKLPKEASPKLSIFLNECSTLHGMRAFIALHVLTSSKSDPVLNAEAVIHMWYSSRVPKAIWDHIHRIAGGSVMTVLVDIAKYDRARQAGQDGDSNVCRSRWSRGGFSLDTELTRGQWQELWKRINNPGTLNMTKMTAHRFLDVRKHSAPAACSRARMTKARLMGVQKWEYDGMLLPFGHPRDDFDTPNPLFMQESSELPPGATQEPIGEWPMELLDYEDCPAPNDVYGKAFYYLRDLLVQFQRRLATLEVHVQLTSTQANEFVQWDDDAMVDLPFDRVYGGELWDQHPLLTLVAFSRALSHRDENPCATLVVHTVTPVLHNLPIIAKDVVQESALLRQPMGTVLDEYAPPQPRTATEANDGMIRRQYGIVLWRNWDRFAAKYFASAETFSFLSLMPLDKPVKMHQSVFQTGFLGMTVRDKHMVATRWPLRLVHSRNDKPSLRDFNRYMGWATQIPLRHIEWMFSGEDPRDCEWELWMALAQQRTKEVYLKQLARIVNGEPVSKVEDEVTVSRVEGDMEKMLLETVQVNAQAAGSDAGSSDTTEIAFTDDYSSGDDEELAAIESAAGVDALEGVAEGNVDGTAGNTAAAERAAEHDEAHAAGTAGNTADVDETVEHDEDKPKKSGKKKSKKSKGKGRKK
ncbi:MYND finger family protein [Purpureocillium lavendulum]|uniref:MYND finger family protein n=1 Tax=Purpureocillium lavendulum TaxID=1247861 RepID=A0AB34FS59_9HYPO|nr:MYND finger family protein [Purpureocillium lavendulum]